MANVEYDKNYIDLGKSFIACAVRDLKANVDAEPKLASNIYKAAVRTVEDTFEQEGFKDAKFLWHMTELVDKVLAAYNPPTEVLLVLYCESEYLSNGTIQFMYRHFIDKDKPFDDEAVRIIKASWEKFYEDVVKEGDYTEERKQEEVAMWLETTDKDLVADGELNEDVLNYTYRTNENYQFYIIALDKQEYIW